MSIEADRLMEPERPSGCGDSSAADKTPTADSGCSAIGYEAAYPALQAPLWREEVQGARSGEKDRP